MSGYATYRELAPAASSKPRGILRFVIAVGPARTQFIIVVFALAMLYGSVCSASCAAGVCLNLGDYSDSHHCDQLLHHHSYGPHDHGQHGPDCKRHAHPPDLALKGSATGPFQDRSMSVLQAGAVLASLSTTRAITQDIHQASCRKPPSDSKSTLPQRVSVLRI